MRTPEPAAAEPAADPYAEPTRWAIAHAPYGDPVRAEACRMAQSAVLRRWVLFGVEDGLNAQTARELLQMLGFLTSGGRDAIARFAAARAMLEDDRECLAALAEVCAGQLAWFAEWDACTAAEAAERLGGSWTDAEALAMARLISLRRHPQLFAIAWLDEVPAGVPRLAGAMAQAAAERRGDLAGEIAVWLAAHLPALMAQDPDLILAPLARASARPPQELLAPFAGIYGDASVLAAAEWHLEHGQADAARTLARRLRPQGPLADRARLLCVLAGCALGGAELADARHARAAIHEHDPADHADLALAQADPGQLDPAAIAAIAGRARADQPERFAACLRLLLARRQLVAARQVGAEGAARFAGHPVVAQMLLALGAR